MSITILGTRFGDLEIGHERVITMPYGLIGIPGTRYTLVGEPGDAFWWLQSVDDPAFAVPVTDPARFGLTPAIDLTDVAGTGEDHAVLVVVRASERLEDFTVNLAAPIVVSQNTAWQVVNQQPDAPLREPLFPPAPVAAAA